MEAPESAAAASEEEEPPPPAATLPPVPTPSKTRNFGNSNSTVGGAKEAELRHLQRRRLGLLGGSSRQQFLPVSALRESATSTAVGVGTVGDEELSIQGSNNDDDYDDDIGVLGKGLRPSFQVSASSASAGTIGDNGVCSDDLKEYNNDDDDDRTGQQEHLQRRGGGPEVQPRDDAPIPLQHPARRRSHINKNDDDDDDDISNNNNNNNNNRPPSLPSSPSREAASSEVGARSDACISFCCCKNISSLFMFLHCVHRLQLLTNVLYVLRFNFSFFRTK